MALPMPARRVAEPETQIDLACPVCGRTWSVAAVLSGVWWGRAVTPAAIAACCHCPYCHAAPPMAAANPPPLTAHARPAAAGWRPEERALVDELRVRAGLETDADVIALALYRLARWYDLQPPATAFATGRRRVVARPARARAGKGDR